ncbi:MAG: hypothetical protein WC456_01520 [Patescibacteria group bacterium]
MKRKLLFCLALVFFLLALTACSPKPSGQDQAGGGASLDQSARGRDKRPDFGQPDRPADIRGIVKSIVGNEVTILKVDPAGRASSTPAASPEKNASGPAAVSLSGANAPSGMAVGRGLGGGPGGVQTEGARAEMLAKLKEMSTGEEKVLIPVGIKMIKPSAASNGRGEMIEATLVDVAADKMLTIWLDASTGDRKVADFVLINN